MTMTEVIMSKKRYPDEFKVEAVKQVVDCGHSVADVAGRLGMTTHSLYAWIKKFGPDSAEHNAMSDEQAEIRRLKKELKRTRQERDILKKAAVSSSLQCNTIIQCISWRSITQSFTRPLIKSLGYFV